MLTPILLQIGPLFKLLLDSYRGRYEELSMNIRRYESGGRPQFDRGRAKLSYWNFAICIPKV